MGLLRAGVVGVGYLGKFHVQKYASLPDVELVGLVDIDEHEAEKKARQYKVCSYTDYRELLDQVDLVSIAVPTDQHFAVARDFLEAGVHVLLEKPITKTPGEAQQLISLAEKNNLTLQVGHIERFNPAMQAIWDNQNEPFFIESHRLAPFNIRGTDVDVVLDLMIHDIDIILSMVKSPLIDIRSTGIPVLTRSTDIANARLEFENGCVANLTASRVSEKHLRKIRVFQHDHYISIDFFGHKIAYHSTCEEKSSNQALPICTEEQSFQDADALMVEIQAFIRSIKEGVPPVVSGHDGKHALEVALEIARKCMVSGNIS